MVEQRDPSLALREASGLDHVDYADRFTAIAPAATDRTPEAWARIAIEGSSALGRFLTWQVLCGLHLEPGPDRVAGWVIAERGGNWIRLAAPSWFLTARIVVHVDEGELTFATFVRYDRTFAGPVWRTVSHIHRRAVPGLLRAATVAHDHGRTGTS
jgi:hypothetical protein